MIYHVLPGDSLAEEFKKTEIEGKLIVFRECLIVGPVDADTPFEFWEERGRFILAEYGEDEIVYHETVADEIEKLSELDDTAEVNLWFEYELFCSVNMWFCLSRLKETGARVFRVEPAVLSREDRWKGFGKLEAPELRECFDARKQLTTEDISLGVDLWNAFRKNDHDRLEKLAKSESARFRYLKEVCMAAIEKDTRPAEIIAEIQFEGKIEFEDIFPEFSKRAGVFGLGDLQVRRIIDQSSLRSSSF